MTATLTPLQIHNLYLDFRPSHGDGLNFTEVIEKAVRMVADQIPVIPEPPCWVSMLERMPTKDDKDSAHEVVWTDGMSVWVENWNWKPEFPHQITHWIRTEDLLELPRQEAAPEEKEFQKWWKDWLEHQSGQTPYPSEGVARHMFKSIRAIA